MPDALISQLLDFGALGIFAGFLIWQHLGMQKRLDALVERFQGQLDKINADYDGRIEVMRERYDVVIGGIRSEASDAQKDFLLIREKIHDDLVDKIDDNSRKLDSALKKIETGLKEMREHYVSVEIEKKAREIASKDVP